MCAMVAWGDEMILSISGLHASLQEGMADIKGPVLRPALDDETI